jgi:hypothetical protein
MENILQPIEFADTCLPLCNTMRHIEPENVVARQAFLEAIRAAGIYVSCAGPREGLIHPVCRLSEAAKCHAKLLVHMAALDLQTSQITPTV